MARCAVLSHVANLHMTEGEDITLPDSAQNVLKSQKDDKYLCGLFNK